MAVPLDREFTTEIKLLSAGAVKSGLKGLIDGFQRTTGHEVKTAFATAPAIQKRVTDGETADVLIAPTGVLDDLARDGKVSAANRIPLGRVGVGVVVRDAAPVPDIATVEAFKQSVLRAETLVYNQASTGIYLAGLFDQLGIADHLKAKTKQYPNGVAVLDHVSRGNGREIGFGAVTEIIGHGKSGFRLIGPLPAQIQNYTTYEVTDLAAGAAANAAQAFVRYLTTPEAKAAFAAAGME